MLQSQESFICLSALFTLHAFSFSIRYSDWSDSSCSEIEDQQKSEERNSSLSEEEKEEEEVKISDSENEEEGTKEEPKVCRSRRRNN